MKKIILLFLLFTFTIFCQAQRHTDRSYEVLGLPDGEEVGKYLLIAIPFLLIGFLITYATSWSKSAKERNKSSESSNWGCFGLILMGIGIFCLFPLLSWIELIFVSGMQIVFILAILAFIIIGIYSLFKKK